MLASGHGEGHCDPNPTLVAELRLANAEVESPTARPASLMMIRTSSVERAPPLGRPGQRGYFERVGEAGRYTRAGALLICQRALVLPPALASLSSAQAEPCTRRTPGARPDDPGEADVSAAVWKFPIPISDEFVLRHVARRRTFVRRDAGRAGIPLVWGHNR